MNNRDAVLALANLEKESIEKKRSQLEEAAKGSTKKSLFLKVGSKVLLTFFLEVLIGITVALTLKNTVESKGGGSKNLTDASGPLIVINGTHSIEDYVRKDPTKVASKTVDNATLATPTGVNTSGIRPNTKKGVARLAKAENEARLKTMGKIPNKIACFQSWKVAEFFTHLGSIYLDVQVCISNIHNLDVKMNVFNLGKLIWGLCNSSILFCIFLHFVQMAGCTTDKFEQFYKAHNLPPACPHLTFACCRTVKLVAILDS